MKAFYLTPRFFMALTILICVFVLSYPFPLMFIFALSGFAILTGMVLVDTLLLFFPKTTLHASRRMNSTLSLGDEQTIKIRVSSRMSLPTDLVIYDEAPFQLQLRNLKMFSSIAPGESVMVEYKITPKERGKFVFGDIRIFASTLIGLVQRRITHKAESEIGVYPSVIQMRQYELKVFNKLNLTEGIKKVRRLGHSTEFEQIKNYVQGDDYRSINWKATSRKNEIMVNQYEDEKAQQVYCIIDKSRSMRMPFGGMTLLDYAINSTLVILNIALRKSDRAGLITFSDKLGTRISAERTPVQMRKIQDALYKQKTKFNEANYELLYFGTRQIVKGRSLLLLFTNFESTYALQRVLPILRRINSQHLLVVVFFENTELAETSEMETKDVKSIYLKTIAQKMVHEKKAIAEELRKHAIQTILTTPENLSVDTINKYLELKSRGLI